MPVESAIARDSVASREKRQEAIATAVQRVRRSGLAARHCTPRARRYDPDVSRDKQKVRDALNAHLAAPDCATCRAAFEEALAAYREKYAALDPTHD